jgi:hypothetical protein
MWPFLLWEDDRYLTTIGLAPRCWHPQGVSGLAPHPWHPQGMPLHVIVMGLAWASGLAPHPWHPQGMPLHFRLSSLTAYERISHEVCRTCRTCIICIICITVLPRASKWEIFWEHLLLPE